MFRSETINKVDTQMKQNVKKSQENSKSYKKKYEISCRYCAKRNAKVRQQCPAPLKFGRAKNVQKSVRFTTTFEFERKYLWNRRR